MARRAVWRRASDDPRGIVGWIARDRKVTDDGMPARTLAGWLVAIALTATFWSAWALLALPFPLLMLGRRRPPPDVDALATEPPPGPAFVVGLEVGREIWTLGKDVGVLTFVDGWIHFAGRRTEFAVRPADVGDARLDDGRIVARDETGTFVHFALEKGQTERALAAWRSLAPVAGEPLLPPGGVHPSGVAASLLGAARIASFVLVILALLLSFAPWWAALALVWALVGRASFWRGVGSLRELGRESRRALR